MTDFITEVKKLMDDTGNAVSQLRQSQEQAIAELAKGPGDRIRSK